MFAKNKKKKISLIATILVLIFFFTACTAFELNAQRRNMRIVATVTHTCEHNTGTRTRNITRYQLVQAANQVLNQMVQQQGGVPEEITRDIEGFFRDTLMDLIEYNYMVMAAVARSANAARAQDSTQENTNWAAWRDVVNPASPNAFMIFPATNAAMMSGNNINTIRPVPGADTLTTYVRHFPEGVAGDEALAGMFDAANTPLLPAEFWRVIENVNSQFEATFNEFLRRVRDERAALDAAQSDEDDDDDDEEIIRMLDPRQVRTALADVGEFDRENPDPTPVRPFIYFRLTNGVWDYHAYNDSIGIYDGMDPEEALMRRDAWRRTKRALDTNHVTYDFLFREALDSMMIFHFRMEVTREITELFDNDTDFTDPQVLAQLNQMLADNQQAFRGDTMALMSQLTSNHRGVVFIPNEDSTGFFFVRNTLINFDPIARANIANMREGLTNPYNNEAFLQRLHDARHSGLVMVNVSNIFFDDGSDADLFYTPFEINFDENDNPYVVDYDNTRFSLITGEEWIENVLPITQMVERMIEFAEDYANGITTSTMTRLQRERAVNDFVEQMLVMELQRALFNYEFESTIASSQLAAGGITIAEFFAGGGVDDDGNPIDIDNEGYFIDFKTAAWVDVEDENGQTESVFTFNLIRIDFGDNGFTRANMRTIGTDEGEVNARVLFYFGAARPSRAFVNQGTDIFGERFELCFDVVLPLYIASMDAAANSTRVQNDEGRIAMLLEESSAWFFALNDDPGAFGANPGYNMHEHYFVHNQMVETFYLLSRDLFQNGQGAGVAGNPIGNYFFENEDGDSVFYTLSEFGIHMIIITYVPFLGQESERAPEVRGDGWLLNLNHVFDWTNFSFEADDDGELVTDEYGRVKVEFQDILSQNILNHLRAASENFEFVRARQPILTAARNETNWSINQRQLRQIARM